MRALCAAGSLTSAIGLVFLAGYVMACALWPFAACRWCEGRKKCSPTGRAWRRCGRCKGTGRGSGSAGSCGGQCAAGWTETGL